MARLAIVGVCDMDCVRTAVGVRIIVGVRDNTGSGSGVQREWLARCPP
jgi:hypothetical protein